MSDTASQLAETDRTFFTSLVLEQWLQTEQDNFERSRSFGQLMHSVESLMLEDAEAAVAIIDTVVQYAFENVKYRMLFNVASTLVKVLNESKSLNHFLRLDDGAYRLAMLVAISVEGMDHFDEQQLRNNRDAVRFLTKTDFEFSRNYNKHFEQATAALFGETWVALYADALAGASSVLSVLLHERVPLLFVEQNKADVDMPHDFPLNQQSSVYL